MQAGAGRPSHPGILRPGVVFEPQELMMTVDRAVFAVAGTLVLVSVALGYFVSPYWFLLTAFVGLNMFQSAFTGICPARSFLRMLGLKTHPAGNR
jgi:hypothetical protein